MIFVIVEKKDYQYDIHSLFSAFYPGIQVRVLSGDEYELAKNKEKKHKKNPEIAKQKDILFYLSWNEETISLSRADDEDSFLNSKKLREVSGLLLGGTEKSVQEDAKSSGTDDNRAKEKAKNSDNPEVEEVRSFKEKDLLKLYIYSVLNEYTGKSLPWGNMIGVRPVKMASNMLEEGYRNSQIAAKLKKDHRVSDRKTILAVEIANREADVLCRIAGISNENLAAGEDRKRQLEQVHDRLIDGISLYVGIPFCPTTCLYCSFTSYSICAYKELVPKYLEALKGELEAVADMIRGGLDSGKGKRIDTVYIGGGTPTALDEESFEELLSYVTSRLDFSHVKEFTVEAGRADSITEKKLQLMKDYGVTRISINPQTMKQSTLNLIGRAATVDATVEAYKLARLIGHDNINMDLILGLPGETVADVQNTLKLVGELDPDSVTVHSLAIKKASRLYRVLEQGLMKGQVYRDSKTGAIWTVPRGDMGSMQPLTHVEDLLPKSSEVNEAMEYTYDVTRQWEQYPYYLYRQKQMSGSLENVGFAKTGKEGLYNILMMEEVQTIIACGAGTVTKRVYPDGRIERCDNVKDVALYIEKIDEMIDRKRELFKD